MNKEEALQVLDGLMLGDGSLLRHPDTACYRMDQSKRTISLEDHLKWEYWLRDNVFKALSIRATVKSLERTTKDQFYRGKLYRSYKFKYAHLQTEYSGLLAQVHDEWYTGGVWTAPYKPEESFSSRYLHEAVKIVPERLMRASVLPIHSLVHWLLGDGGSSRDNHYSSVVGVAFSTFCFSREEVYHLTNMLNNMGIGTTKPMEYSHKGNSGLAIRLSQDSVDLFMTLVEPQILDIFGDSISPSYRNVIKYKDSAKAEFSNLRRKIGGRKHE